MFLLSAGLLLALATGCGRDEETPTEEGASVETVDTATAPVQSMLTQEELQAQRRDSISKELDRNRIVYDQDGSFVVQVSSWRSVEKAQRNADMWKSRGFRTSFVQESGDGSTGDVWFRVRIGNFASRDMAERVKAILSSEYSTLSWISDLENDPVAKSSEDILE